MAVDTSSLPPIPDGFQLKDSSGTSAGTGTGSLPPIPDGFQLKTDTPEAKPSTFDYYVKNPAIAAGKAIASDAGDIGNAITHPVDTAMSMGNAITHPIDTVTNTVKNLPDTVMNHPLQTAAMALPGAEGAAGLAEKGVATAKTAMTDLGKQNLQNRIFNLYNSSVGAKVKNLGDVTKLQPQRMTALKTMSDNLPHVVLESGEETPKNRYDLAQTLKQTKSAIWQKVSDMSGGATDAGAKIQMSPIVQKAVNDTVKGIGEDALKANPQLLRSLQQEAMNVSKIGETTPSRAQIYMASLNKELKPMFNSGKAVDYSVLDFKRNLVNHLNDATESAIQNTLNQSGYGALRDQYGALLSSEKEIVGAANKYLRQEGGQAGGISHPIVNLWSLENLMQAGGKLITGRPMEALGDVGKAATIKIASKLADFMKNPDNKIEKMFELLKKYESPQAKIDESVNNAVAAGAASESYGGVREGELVNKRKEIGYQKPMLRSGRALPSPRTAGQSSGPTITPEYKAPNGLPFYTADEQGRIKGTGFLMGEKRLTSTDVNDKLTMAEKPIGDQTNMEQLSDEDKKSSIKMNAEMAKEELKTIQSWRKDLSGTISPKEFKKGEFQDTAKQMSWAKSNNELKGMSLDDKASEFFKAHPEAWPQGFNGQASDALGQVIKDLSNKGMSYHGYLRNVIAAGRKLK